MRTFVLKASKALTTPNFSDPYDAGRMDIVCRCVVNSLLISNGIRKDSAIHVVLEGHPSPPLLLSFYGDRLRNLRPDEKSATMLIKEGIKNRSEEGKRVTKDNVVVEKKSFEALLRELDGRIYYLTKEGKDIREIEIAENSIWVLGDHRGLPPKTEKFLKKLNATEVSIGPVELLASQCITIVHNELDRRARSSTDRALGFGDFSDARES